MKLSQQFDYELLEVAEKRPLLVEKPSKKLDRLDKHDAVWNLTTNQLASIVSKDYNLIQHKEAVKALLTALDNLNIKYSYNSWCKNNRVVVDIRFDDIKMYAENKIDEEFYAGIRLINSYDKTTGIVVVPRLVRIVCTNGMVLNQFINGFSIAHHTKLATEFEGEIERVINTIINSNDKLSALVNDCIKDSIEWKSTELLCKFLFNNKKHIEAIGELLKDKKTITRWDLYNAITNYATHGQQVTPNVEAWLQNLAQKVLKNNFEKLNEMALVVKNGKTK